MPSTMSTALVATKWRLFTATAGKFFAVDGGGVTVTGDGTGTLTLTGTPAT